MNPLEWSSCLAIAAGGAGVAAHWWRRTRLAEAEARRWRSRFELLGDHAGEAFWICSWPALNPVLATAAFARVFPVPAATPRAWLESVHAEDRPAVERALQEAATGNPDGVRCPFRILMPDRSMRWIDLRLMGIPDGSGQVRQIAGLAADVTMRRTVEERLGAGQRLESLGQLTGGVAHDFNNQLAAILGYGELIAQRSEGEVRRWAETLVTAAKRSSSLTRQLLAFARQRPATARVPVDLHQLIREALELTRVGSSGLRVESRLDCDPAVVVGDAGLLQNALVNLCLNARDAMPGGGRMIVSTSLRAVDGPAEDPRLRHLAPGSYVAVAVADTGVGMPPEVVARLFEPFFTTKPVGKGTGLGLAAAHSIVLRHGGAILVDSEEGQGSTFTIWLPLGIGGVQGSTTAMPSLPPGLTVLVADDESGVRGVIAEQLRLLGCTVHEAVDADQAVQVWRELRPSVTLVDLIMPGGGPEACTRILTDDPAARVLVVSGFSQDIEVQRLLAVGAAGFIQKPFNGRDLADALRRAVVPGRIDSAAPRPQPPSP